MTDKKNNPLDDLRTANEEAYFRRRNAELVEALKKKMAVEKGAAEIEAETGVQDATITEQLAQLGVTSETVRVLHLVPLVEVAWADGEIHPEERALLLEAAASAGLDAGPARAAFEEMLVARPTQGYFDTAMEFVRAMLVVMDDERATKACENLEQLAHRVADATGGVWGLWGRIDEEERAVLHRLSNRLATSRPEAAKKLLEKV